MIDLAELKARREQIRAAQVLVIDPARPGATLRSRPERGEEVWPDLESVLPRVRSRLDEATLAERQRILQLLIERVIVGEDSLEIRHVIPLGRGGGARVSVSRGAPLGQEVLQGSEAEEATPSLRNSASGAVV